MGKIQDDRYHRGYVAGYRDGIIAATNGISMKMLEEDFTNTPVEGMTLSTRAYHCLKQAGCVYISDVVALDDDAILAMRGLGKITANEIARCLDAKGICYSNWSKYI